MSQDLGLIDLIEVTPNTSVIDINVSDQGPAQKFFYPGCAPVLYFKLIGAGHQVASTIVLTSYSPTSGYQNHDIEFAQQAWNFFETLN